MSRLAFFFVFLLTFGAHAAEIPALRALRPSAEALREDLALILKAANLDGRIGVRIKAADGGQHVARTANVTCSAEGATITVDDGEATGQTFYLVLRKMGFLFPHPRWQISPTWKEIEKTCGSAYEWKPVLRYAGFHLHTLHPSEWVEGFLGEDRAIAMDTVRWLARNQQNVFDLSLLEMEPEEIGSKLQEPFALAKSLGIHTGVTFGLALGQQSSFKLIDWLATYFDGWSSRQLENGLNELLDQVDVSFVNVEMGTTEFTPTNFERTLAWLNQTATIAEKRGVAMLTKIHTSTGQTHEKWGNFNFLPRFANDSVGVLPHTVYLYSLEEEKAPMYGNENFHAIRDFMVAMKGERRTWFYPETSYYCSLDVDVPLLLTEYLTTRSADMEFLAANGIEGQLNFSTGQEFGYWLFDWTTALLNDRDLLFDPYSGLRLLGEDVASWKKIVEYQRDHFVVREVIGSITGTELGSELLGSIHKTLKKNLLVDLRDDPAKLSQEIFALRAALTDVPKDVTIKNEELARLWRVTRLRVEHALEVRLAMETPGAREVHLITAAALRGEAQKDIDSLVRNTRYPEAQLYERHENLTSYPYGYGYSAATLHYWNREEQMVANDEYGAFHMSLLSWWDVIAGQVL